MQLTTPPSQTVAVNDELLLPNEIAARLRISRRTLIDRTRKKQIPVLKINERTFRDHLPTVLAALGGQK